MNWYVKTFNELTVSELYSILKERVGVFVVEQTCPYPECDGKDNKCFHLFAEENNEVIAYLRILPPGVSYDEAALGRVLVKEGYRRKGLAIEMINRAIKFIEEEMKLKKIKISAQQYLIDFYESFGFKVFSEGYLEDGIPHIDMIYEKQARS
ncbi:GNAT family N-acetyltransferase [Clostridium bovifaecis]|uniref:GNAT family N-acetyltransferase n=1 Tax=Clostridium bovifaecis TaxID=2184719 RepID=A0A6I6F0Q7_9CLOT|nr:GNAT family N-acetyltransferase [Clostridium bovifaecis]